MQKIFHHYVQSFFIFSLLYILNGRVSFPKDWYIFLKKEKKLFHPIACKLVYSRRRGNITGIISLVKDRLPISSPMMSSSLSHNQFTRDYVQAPAKPVKPLTSSRTLDSLVELQSTKINTPSMSSSGYGSQAVSTTNLTSEDSISVKSISVDETPDLEYRNLLDSKRPERMDSSLVEETPEEYMGEVTNALSNLNAMENTCGEG